MQYKYQSRAQSHVVYQQGSTEKTIFVTKYVIFVQCHHKILIKIKKKIQIYWSESLPELEDSLSDVTVGSVR